MKWTPGFKNNLSCPLFRSPLCLVSNIAFKLDSKKSLSKHNLFYFIGGKSKKLLKPLIGSLESFLNESFYPFLLNSWNLKTGSEVLYQLEKKW